jgi:anti-anti-sigma factor
MATNYDFDAEVVDGRLVVRGDCDLTTARRLNEHIAAFDGHDIELDLGGVTFFDSTALAVLLAARERNPGLRVGDVSQEVAIVLKITGTFRYLRETMPHAASS